jgi:hypothetical protein
MSRATRQSFAGANRIGKQSFPSLLDKPPVDGYLLWVLHTGTGNPGPGSTLASSMTQLVSEDAQGFFRSRAGGTFTQFAANTAAYGAPLWEADRKYGRLMSIDDDNLFAYSQGETRANWTNSVVTMTGWLGQTSLRQYMEPDGGAPAVRTNVQSYATAASGTRYTMWMVLQPIGAFSCCLYFGASGAFTGLIKCQLTFGETPSAVIDAVSKTANTTAGITDLGSGLYLCYLSDIAQANGALTGGLVNRDATASVGDPTRGVILHHWQLNNGAYAKCPISTAGTARTRNPSSHYYALTNPLYTYCTSAFSVGGTFRLREAQESSGVFEFAGSDSWGTSLLVQINTGTLQLIVYDGIESASYSADSALTIVQDVSYSWLAEIDGSGMRLTVYDPSDQSTNAGTEGSGFADWEAWDLYNMGQGLSAMHAPGWTRDLLFYDKVFSAGERASTLAWLAGRASR